MNVVSLELNRELHELSDRGETFNWWEYTDGIPAGEPYLIQPELVRRYGPWERKRSPNDSPHTTSATCFGGCQRIYARVPRNHWLGGLSGQRWPVLRSGSCGTLKTQPRS